MNKLLNKKRQEVDNLDYELLKILSERFKITDEIGVLKKTSDQNTLQPERFKNILETRIKFSSDLNINKDFIIQLFTLIHNESIKRQLL